MVMGKDNPISSDTKTVLTGLIDGIAANNLFILAAGLSYYFVIALFPGLVFLSAVASYLPFADVSSHTFSLFSGFIPNAQMHMISKFMTTTVVPNREALLTIGAVGTLWAASSAFESLIFSISVAYGAPDTRSFWITRPIAIGLTITIGILLLIAFAVLTVGPQFGNWLAAQLGLSAIVGVVWPYIRWIIAVVAAIVSVETLYLIAPRQRHRFGDRLPGAILAICGWLALTYLLGSYFRSRAAQSNLYGPLAGGIAFMVWLYWAAFMVLFGAQLNAEIEKRRHLQTTAAADAKPRIWQPPASPVGDMPDNDDEEREPRRRRGWN